MNASTTSLVSTTSSSSGPKPYTCVHTSEHTHAAKYTSRVHCSFRTPPSFRYLRPFATRKSTKPELRERERHLCKREADLMSRERELLTREDAVTKRECSVRSAFFELAQGKVKEACNAAARKQEEEKDRGGDSCRSWRRMWRRGDDEEKGWAKWKEGRFV